MSQCDWDGLAQLRSIMARGSGLSLAWFMSDYSLFSPLLTWVRSSNIWICSRSAASESLCSCCDFKIVLEFDVNMKVQNVFFFLQLWITMCCMCLNHIALKHSKWKLPLHLYYKCSQSKKYRPSWCLCADSNPCSSLHLLFNMPHHTFYPFLFYVLSFYDLFLKC